MYWYMDQRRRAYLGVRIMKTKRKRKRKKQSGCMVWLVKKRGGKGIYPQIIN